MLSTREEVLQLIPSTNPDFLLFLIKAWPLCLPERFAVTWQELLQVAPGLDPLAGHGGCSSLVCSHGNGLCWM